MARIYGDDFIDGFVLYMTCRRILPFPHPHSFALKHAVTHRHRPDEPLGLDVVLLDDERVSDGEKALDRDGDRRVARCR